MWKAWMLALALALALATTGAARAHGDAGHAKKDTVRKEQKAWGAAGEARAVRRTVELVMSDDMRFTPSKLTARRGETLRLVFHNKGRLLHEFVLGTAKELAEHAALMAKFPDMEHDEPYMAHVPAGQKGEIIWTFNRAGRFEFACLIAGHYQAGMTGSIDVVEGVK